MGKREQRQKLISLFSESQIPCELRMPDGSVIRGGEAAPRFVVTVKDERVLDAGLDELALAEAYLREDLDIEGDMLALFEFRLGLNERKGLMSVLRLLKRLYLTRPQDVNSEAVSDHYELGDDFYLTFLDKQARVYTQGHFESDSDSLEEAIERKLDVIAETLGVGPGMRLLDIGGGWGGVAEHAARLGAEVTVLTISPNSEAYMKSRFEAEGLQIDVRLEDFLDHQPSVPYDGIVILGVIEHIPYYRRFAQRSWSCLRPGGMIYLDASANTLKYDIPRFLRRYIWTGATSFMVLQDVIRELLFNGFQILTVRNEADDYRRTIQHWAERFDNERKQVAERWGESTYRTFKLYLWASVHALAYDRAQAYRLIARRREVEGPRPNAFRRFAYFVRDLVQ